MTEHQLEVERWSGPKAFIFSLFNRSPKSNAAVIERLGLTPEDRFLDLGCGAGAALEHAVATGALSAGIDPSPPMARRAGERVPGAEVKVGSAEEIPFGDATFDVAIAISTYHHWADAAVGLDEVRRVLAPGGRLLVVERLLRKATGHGLSPRAGDELADALTAHGYVGALVDRMRVGRSEYLAISATTPGIG